MNLTEMIYKRKSVRSFTNEPVSASTLQDIQGFVSVAKPLYPDIKVKMEILERNQVKCICPWTTPQLITIFSEEKPGYLENAGFIFQQLDLYLQSIGLGACWLGMGKLDAEDVFEEKRQDGLKFVIMIAFGNPKGKYLRSGAKEFKRKLLAEIADKEDPRLEPARLAPSSVNSQPWYFVHGEAYAGDSARGDGTAGDSARGEMIHVYCAHKGMLSKKLGSTNQLDVGIALAHMYVANESTFEFEKLANIKGIKDHTYIGSFRV